MPFQKLFTELFSVVLQGKDYLELVGHCWLHGHGDIVAAASLLCETKLSLLNAKRKKVWRRQVFLPQGKISSFQAVQQIGISQSPCIRSLRASTCFMLFWETIISFVCQIFSPHLLAKIVCCMGASFLTPEKAFNLLLPARWGALYLSALCPPASPRRAVPCCPAHPSCVCTRTTQRLPEYDRGLASFLTHLVAPFHTSDSLSLALFTVCLFFSFWVARVTFFPSTIWIHYTYKSAVLLDFFAFMLSYCTPSLLWGRFLFFYLTLFFQVLDTNPSLIIVLPLPSGVIPPPPPPNSSLSSCLKFSVNCDFKLCNNHCIPWFISFEEARGIWKISVSFQELLI